MREARVVTVEAIVLKRRNVGEADRLLTLFTKRDGKMRILAKGVRKVSSRRGPHIEVFNRIKATLHDKKTLTEVVPLETFEMLRKDLRRVSAAYYLCEVIDGLLPVDQPHEDIYDLLTDAVRTLAKVSSSRIDVLRARFAAALLKKLGFLSTTQSFKDNDIDGYIEELLERRLKTNRIASKLNV